MKRKTPLRSHKVGQKPKPLKRTPIRRVSKKRKVENDKYLEIRDKYLRAHPYCEVCPYITYEADPPYWEATQIHHKMGRGKYLCAVEFFCAICHECHEWVESHKNQAREMGLILYK